MIIRFGGGALQRVVPVLVKGIEHTQALRLRRLFFAACKSFTAPTRGGWIFMKSTGTRAQGAMRA
ncbi:hypothetical protein ATY81_22615 [Rhizobium sp. R72]|nr:hypothetical protein ATY81_22615 [Rhizobium sp. R72]OWW02194.1 hypothetical protein ATY80_22615 [Rhizobium sp. R711]